MPPQLYLYAVETGGYALDSMGAGYNFDELETADFRTWWATYAPEAPNCLYMLKNDNRTFARTSDWGATWQVWTMTAWPTNTTLAGIECRKVDDLYTFQTEIAAASAGRKGIWHSLDGGTTWTQLFALPNTLQWRGGQTGIGATKLWYAECTAYVSSPVSTTFAIKTCNWDGTGITTVGSITYPISVYGVKLRPWGDDFVLVMSPHPDAKTLHKVTMAGVVTDIRPPSLIRPWEVTLFDATTYVAVGCDETSGLAPSYIHRTTNGGSSWTLVQTIVREEGFVETGTSGHRHVHAVPGSTTHAYLMGRADSVVQQCLWKTIDGGVTWTLFHNQAELQDISGWLDYGTTGVLAIGAAPVVAVPSRLATIVG